MEYAAQTGALHMQSQMAHSMLGTLPTAYLPGARRPTPIPLAVPTNSELESQ